MLDEYKNFINAIGKADENLLRKTLTVLDACEMASCIDTFHKSRSAINVLKEKYNIDLGRKLVQDELRSRL